MTTEIIEKRRMKLSQYLSIAITTFVLFVISSVVVRYTFKINWTAAQPSTQYIWGTVLAVILIVNVLYLASISIQMLVSSLKKTFSFSREKSLWKILTIVFGIVMTIFVLAIIGVITTFIFYTLKFGTFNLRDWNSNPHPGGGFGEKPQEFADWTWANINTAQAFIANETNNRLGSFQNEKLPNSPHFLYLSSFVLIMSWSGIGLAYEIIKKFLGGNRLSKKEKQRIQEKMAEKNNNLF